MDPPWFGDTVSCALCVSDSLIVKSKVGEELADIDTERVDVKLLVVVSVILALSEPLLESDMLTESESDTLMLTLLEKVGDAVGRGERVSLMDCVLDRVFGTEIVADCVSDIVVSSENVDVPFVRVSSGVSEMVMVPDSVAENVKDPDGVSEID